MALAWRAGLSPLAIGVTLVGMGTSLPELLTSVRAAQQGAAGIALGNVVGSNIADIGLILGTAAVPAPIAFPRATWRRDGLVLLALTVLGALWVGLAAGLARPGGLAFLAAFAIWMAWQLGSGGSEEAEPSGLSPRRAALLLLAGFAGVLFGAELLVRGAIGAARALDVSEAVIGLTVVAVGTSLPELAASVVAARRGRADLALGNVLGSNVFNLLGILGLAAVVAPVTGIDARVVSVDLPVMAAAVVLLLILGLRGRIGRGAGGELLLAYAAYAASLAF